MRFTRPFDGTVQRFAILVRALNEELRDQAWEKSPTDWRGVEVPFSIRPFPVPPNAEEIDVAIQDLWPTESGDYPVAHVVVQSRPGGKVELIITSDDTWWPRLERYWQKLESAIAAYHQSDAGTTISPESAASGNTLIDDRQAKGTPWQVAIAISRIDAHFRLPQLAPIARKTHWELQEAVAQVEAQQAAADLVRMYHTSTAGKFEIVLSRLPGDRVRLQVYADRMSADVVVPAWEHVRSELERLGFIQALAANGKLAGALEFTHAGPWSQITEADMNYPSTMQDASDFLTRFETNYSRQSTARGTVAQRGGVIPIQRGSEYYAQLEGYHQAWELAVVTPDAVLYRQGIVALARINDNLTTITVFHNGHEECVRYERELREALNEETRAASGQPAAETEQADAPQPRSSVTRRGGRPRNADDDWAYHEVRELERPPTDVYPEWLARIGQRAQTLADPRDSFNKAISPRRKKKEETEETE